MAKRYVRAKHVKTKTARSIAAYTVDDYMNYLTNTKKIIKNNLIAGLARGLGMAVGFSILGAVVIYLLTVLAGSGVPIIDKLISYIMDIVERNS